MPNDITAEQARGVLEACLKEQGKFQDFPFYKRQLQDTIESCLAHANIIYKPGVLLFQNDADGVHTCLQIDWIDYGNALRFILSRELDLYGNIDRTLQTITVSRDTLGLPTILKVQSISNYLISSSQGVTLTVKENYFESLMTDEGFEVSRKEETGHVPYPILLREVPEKVYGVSKIGKDSSIKDCDYLTWDSLYAEITTYPEMDELGFPKNLEDHVATRVMDPNNEKAQKIFPYFHDANGFIQLHPFLEIPMSQLCPCFTDRYPYDASKLYLYDVRRMKEYLEWVSAQRRRMPKIYYNLLSGGRTSLEMEEFMETTVNAEEKGKRLLMRWEYNR